MGYDLHITRADYWYDNEKNPITTNEWLSYVSSDPDMRLDGYAETDIPGDGVLRVENEGIAVWTAWSKNGIEGSLSWFYHQSGEIQVANPDAEIRIKMYKIAKLLNAKLIGDDHETYNEFGESDHTPHA